MSESNETSLNLILNFNNSLMKFLTEIEAIEGNKSASKQKISAFDELNELRSNLVKRKTFLNCNYEIIITILNQLELTYEPVTFKDDFSLKPYKHNISQNINNFELAQKNQYESTYMIYRQDNDIDKLKNISDATSKLIDSLKKLIQVLQIKFKLQDKSILNRLNGLNDLMDALNSFFKNQLVGTSKFKNSTNI